MKAHWAKLNAESAGRRRELAHARKRELATARATAKAAAKAATAAAKAQAQAATTSAAARAKAKAAARGALNRGASARRSRSTEPAVETPLHDKSSSKGQGGAKLVRSSTPRHAAEAQLEDCCAAIRI